MSNQAALVVIDVQVGMFQESEPVFRGEEMIECIQQLISKARLAGVPVIFVQHNGGVGDTLEVGTSGLCHPSRVAASTG